MSAELTRRRFLQYGAGAGVALAAPWAVARAASAAPTLTKYVTPFPVPGNGIVVATPSGANAYAFTLREITKQLHPQLPPTPVWAYDDGSGLGGQTGSFGMAIAARKGTALDITYTHNLPATYPARIPVDTRLTPPSFGNQVRIMTHLHGGLVSGDSDGNPAATPDLYGRGQTQSAHYPNDQPATLAWFHDHGLGTTRLNVFAGLAGAYLIRDEFDTGDPTNANGLPSGAFEIPLVVQDRLFNPNGNGQFLYPSARSRA